MEMNPIAIILVYMDSKGDRLLFRYPYKQTNVENVSKAATISIRSNSGSSIGGGSDSLAAAGSLSSISSASTVASSAAEAIRRRNPYALNVTDDLFQPPMPNNNSSGSISTDAILQVFADDVLSTLFAVKHQLCGQKFELKVNDVRFVSHPTLVQRREQRSSVISTSVGAQTAGNASGTLINTSAASSIYSAANASQVSSTSAGTGAAVSKAAPQQMLINVVFALHAQLSYSIVKCYYELSKKLGLALKVEEQRIGYVTEETAQMVRTHDEVSLPKQPLEHAFDMVLERSSLAQSLKAIYHDLCTTGLLNTTLNQNVTLCFCLPQKAHQMHKKGHVVDPITIDRCLRSLKPYHGMLLLVDFAELLDCVPPAGARHLMQLIDVYTPLMSLQSMASDADLSIEFVYKMVSHLVYWAKATVIYPLCETNVYVIAPDAPLHTKSNLVEKFATRFAGMSLFEVISDFSLPTSIGHLTTPLQQPARQGILAQMVLWMLQHHLLLQLHTYVQFLPGDLNDLYGKEEFTLDCASSLTELHQLSHEELCSDSRSGKSVSDEELHAGSLLSISSQPLPVPHTSRRSITEEQFSGDCSTASDLANLTAQQSSSHKSNLSMTASLTSDNCDSISSIEDEDKIKELLQIFDETSQIAIQRIPASANVDDLTLLVKLFEAGYFKSEHHLEEIMYFENLRRSQLLQLLDKFRDVLIIYETEDPAIASMYNHK